MMPKAINYKSNSVVYFSGDFDGRVFLLNTGNIALTSINIETGAQVTEYIKTGEFFGVKSALGNYPREESAMVLTDSVVYSFTTQEFEAFAQSNTRIILQMIKVFSRQLRTVHKQLASLLDSQEETNPEEGLYTVMSTFYNSKHYKAAFEVAQRYKTTYPNGKYSQEVASIITATGSGFDDNAGGTDVANFTGSVGTDSDSAQVSFNMANDMFAKGEYEAAYDNYHSIIESGVSGQILEEAYIGAGRCLYVQKEFVRCLQLLTGFISQNPKSLKIAEALMYLGLCYQNMDRPDKALSFYDKALLLAEPQLKPKIQELQAKCATN